MKRDARSTDHYRSSVSGAQRDLLEKIRSAIFAAMPQVEEGIRHGMLDYPGLANLGAQKHYVSLYVAPEALALHAEAFAGVDRGKSCLRFKRSEQVDPDELAALLRDVRTVRARADAAD